MAFIINRSVFELHRFASTDPNRFNLNTIRIECAGHTVKAIATDGHRMCIITQTLSEAVAYDCVFNVSVANAKLILKLMKSAKATSATVELTATGNVATVDRSTIKLDLYDGTFPDYYQVLPSPSRVRASNRFGFNAAYVGDLADYLKACGIGTEIVFDGPSDDLSLMEFLAFAPKLGLEVHYVLMPVRL